MKFYLPVGGITDNRFGIITNYNHKATPIGIVNGMRWCGDVPVWGKKGFEPAKWIPWIETMLSHKNTCIFLTCPDVVGDAKKTITHYKTWRPYLNDWPVAFVAQDGMENLEFPDPKKWNALFVGGSTEWKESGAAIECIKRAQKLEKHIHIGRVNWGKRYRMFKILDGSESFTCDGTRTRFEGTQNTIRAWAGYQKQDPLITL